LAEIRQWELNREIDDIYTSIQKDFNKKLFDKPVPNMDDKDSTLHDLFKQIERDENQRGIELAIGDAIDDAIKKREIRHPKFFLDMITYFSLKSSHLAEDKQLLNEEGAFFLSYYLFHKADLLKQDNYRNLLIVPFMISKSYKLISTIKKHYILDVQLSSLQDFKNADEDMKADYVKFKERFKDFIKEHYYEKNKWYYNDLLTPWLNSNN